MNFIKLIDYKEVLIIKKILSILAAVGLVATASTSVISCGNTTKTNKPDPKKNAKPATNPDGSLQNDFDWGKNAGNKSLTGNDGDTGKFNFDLSAKTISYSFDLPEALKSKVLQQGTLDTVFVNGKAINAEMAHYFSDENKENVSPEVRKATKWDATNAALWHPESCDEYGVSYHPTRSYGWGIQYHTDITKYANHDLDYENQQLTVEGNEIGSKHLKFTFDLKFLFDKGILKTIPVDENYGGGTALTTAGNDSIMFAIDLSKDFPSIKEEQIQLQFNHINGKAHNNWNSVGTVA